MKLLKDIYFITSYSLFFAQAGFIAIMLYTLFKHGHIFYYGDVEYPYLVSDTYFKILKSLLYTTFALIVAWAILTPFIVIINKRNDTKEYRDVIVGALGFFVAVILLFIDPFGMMKWITI